MRPSLLLAVVAVACWVMPFPVSAQLTRCMFFSGTADALVKSNAVEESLESLREAIDKWKADNGVTGPVSETAQKPRAASLLAERGLAGPVPSARCGQRHHLHAVLEGRGVAGRLHLRRQGLLVRRA